MSNFFKLGAVAAAAIVVVVVAALGLRGPTPNVGGQPTPEPTTQPTTAASPIPTPTAYQSEWMPWALLLPAGWTPNSAEGDAEGSYETFNKFRPTLVRAGVGSSRVPADMTPEQYLAAGVETEQQNALADCGQTVEPTATTMGGEPASQLLWPCDGQATGITLTTHNGFRYVLIVDTREEAAVRDAMDELLAAFEFTD